jgi:hypothetical protein
MTEGKFVVEFIRYGALLYYPANTEEDAQRFVQLQENLGEATVIGVTAPDGSAIEV